MLKAERYQYIMFDLDGTLTDPALGITRAAAHALRHFSIEVKELSELNWLIGPPLLRSFEEGFGLSSEQAKEALERYREYFSVRGLFENEIYPGIPALLKELKAQGRRVIMATSKPEEYAARIAEHFGILRYFDFIGGNTLHEDRPTKAEVIAYVMENTPGLRPENAVMVGDRSYDIAGAAAHGIGCIGVLYGYGDESELRGALALAATVEELGAILL